MAPPNITRILSSSPFDKFNSTNSLADEFALCDKGNVAFHWADFFETCDLIKARLQSEPGLWEDFNHRDAALNKLQLIPLWVKTERKIHQITVFDLYEGSIFNQAQILVGIDPFSAPEISFISASGPFRKMTIADCLNKCTYRDFVIVSLIKGNLARRNYRIRLKSRILLEYGANVGQAELVSLEQLTTQGILLSLDSDIYLRKIRNVESIRLLVNVKSLAETKGKCLKEFKGYLSHFAFNLLYSSLTGDSIICHMKDVLAQSSFDLARNRRVFLFVSYNKLQALNPQSIGVIKEFVDQTRDLVREHYRPLWHAKVA
jgi:hypothetical protein